MNFFGFICLWFAKLLESVSLCFSSCLLSNLGTCQPLLLQVLFHHYPLSLPFQDFSDPNVIVHKPLSFCFFFFFSIFSLSWSYWVTSIVLFSCLLFCFIIFYSFLSPSFFWPLSLSTELFKFQSLYFSFPNFTFGSLFYLLFLCQDFLYLCWSFLILHLFQLCLQLLTETFLS